MNDFTIGNYVERTLAKPQKGWIGNEAKRHIDSLMSRSMGTYNSEDKVTLNSSSADTLTGFEDQFKKFSKSNLADENNNVKTDRQTPEPSFKNTETNKDDPYNSKFFCKPRSSPSLNSVNGWNIS